MTPTHNTTTPWVGLIGAAGAGKDTVAAVLVAEYGYARLALADQVRASLLALDPFVSASVGRLVRVSDLVARWGWDRAKRDCPEIRVLLQRLGTEVVRNLDPDLWVRKVEELATGAGRPVVVPDVRFVNEEQMIRAHGGIVALVERPGVKERNAEGWRAHSSETAWRQITPDVVLYNTRGVDDLTYEVRRMMRRLAMKEHGHA